jgi:plasmid stabilization system protein ParE
MRYTVLFTPEAQEQLAAIYRHIAAAASPTIAERYVGAVITYCEGLQTFPHRGTCRDDIRSGLRVTNYKKRVAIAFNVDAEHVSILGVFYGGQDYEAIFKSDFDESAE